MNIGLGLLAADEYFKEGDRRQVRDYQQKLRESELSLLDDKASATRSGYQDTAATNAARAQLRPGQTANAQKRIGLDAANMEAEAERQPTENRTRAVNANMGLAKAENAQANVPQTLALENNTLYANWKKSQFELEQLPDKLARAATQGLIDEQGQAEVVLASLGKLIANKDKAGALAFANKVAKTGNLLPGTNGKTFTDIVGVNKGEAGAPGDGFVVVTSQGEKRFIPSERFDSAMAAQKSGKYKFIERDDGSIFAGDEGTGRGAIVQPGDPQRFGSKRAQNTPAEIQTMEWLMSKGVAKTPEAAWELARSSREKTRSSFIMEYVSKNAMPGADTSKMSDDAGRIYDALKQQTSTPSAPAANTGATSWKSMLE